MKTKIITYIIILLFLISILLPITSADSLFSNNKKIAEYNGAILQFYFDEENKSLYLRNIGDETAYNVTYLIEIEGFIILGFGNNLFSMIDTLEPDEEISIVFYPILISLGPIRIIHTASAINADSTSITLKALLIGFFILGLRI